MVKWGPIVLFLCAKLFVWASTSLGIKACTSKYWTYTSSYYAGLWKQCTETTTLSCTAISDTPALNAVRAFVIMGIVFGFIGTITYSAGFFNRNGNSAARAGYGLIYLAALCWTIAMIIYSVTYGYNSVAWGYAFAFGWACMALLNIGGGFAHASVSLKYRDDDFD